MVTIRPKVKEAYERRVEWLRKDPSAGEGAYAYAKVVLLEDTRFEGEVGEVVQGIVGKTHKLFSDEPEWRGGAEQGPTPLEYVLAGIAFCHATQLARYAAFLGVSIDSIETMIRGYLDPRGHVLGLEGVPKGFHKITYEVNLSSQSDPDKIRKVFQLADSRCPALDTLRRPVLVEGNAHLNGEQL